MSTGLNCQVIEWKPGTWYYVLEQGSAPKESWDWREYADAYGPYPSEDKALDDLRRYHANPGGHSVLSYEARREKSDVLAELVSKARKHRSALERFGFR